MRRNYVPRWRSISSTVLRYDFPPVFTTFHTRHRLATAFKGHLETFTHGPVVRGSHTSAAAYSIPPLPVD